MCTILQARAYFNEFFTGVRSRTVKDYIKPFYIPPTYKELQFAAYLLVGNQCLATPVQFPMHEGSRPRGVPLHKWRLDDYIFLYDDKRSFGVVPENFRGFKQLSTFIRENNITGKEGLERITSPAQLIQHIIKEENTKVKQKLSVEAPKIKRRSRDRLVFTYTNGATYTVRGVTQVQINDMSVHYVSKVVDAEGNLTVSEVYRRITNDFCTVVVERAGAKPITLLDLRSEYSKREAEKTEKPTRKHKSRVEYEAEQAQKEAEMAKLAKVEELLNEAAALMK